VKCGSGAASDLDRERIDRLTRWFRRNARDLPWRRAEYRHGYGALVAETMLQQTQALRVVERFERFMQAFSTVQALACADEQAVLAMWQGLGYYRRARNLHAAARMIVDRFAGEVPQDVESLRTLPGVGRYTAGAISSIVFDQPAPIVDGNVQRVLARWDARTDPIEDLTTWFWTRATALAQEAPQPGVFNEAMMELGATVCTPRSPACAACPVCEGCEAFRQEVQGRIPSPKTAPEPSTIHHHAVLIRRSGKLLMVQREVDVMWAGMWQVPTIESSTPLRFPSIVRGLPVTLSGALRRVGRFEHHTTHRRVVFHVLVAATAARRGVWRTIDEVASLPMGNAQRRVVREFGDVVMDQEVIRRKRRGSPAITPTRA